MNPNRITVRAVLLGMFASGLFAWYTVIMENSVGKNPPILTATQIPVLPFLLLILCVLVVNPLLRRIPFIRHLSTPEVMLIFIMTMVSSGISTFGLASQLVPAVSGLFNRSWNTAQARWDRHVEPFMSETYFLSEPGIQERAARAIEAEDAWRKADAVFQTAHELDGARRAANELQEKLAAGADALTPIARLQLKRQSNLERERIKAAEAQWAKHTEQTRLDLQEVLKTYPDQVAGLLAEFKARRMAQAELEKIAFEKVEAFRKGLPKNMRAIPGILPGGDESFTVYRARLSRLREGMAAAGEVAAAREALDAGQLVDGRAALQRAIKRLDPVADQTELVARRQTLVAKRDEYEPLLTKARKETAGMRAERRLADVSEFDALDLRIKAAAAETARLEALLAEITKELERTVDPGLQLAKEVAAIRTSLAGIDAGWDQAKDAAALNAALAKVESEIEALNISWRALFVGAVPWRDWLRPLANWALLIIASYLMLMTLNVLIFRQWAHHEKLSYPLAELPLILSGGGGEGAADDGRVPAIYRDGVFWMGFAISAFVMGWNVLAMRRIVPGIGQISIRFAWDGFINDSIFSGLKGGSHQIFFTMIGLAFLVPARISKSLWGFHVIYMGLLLVLVWFGRGVNIDSFPSNMNLVLNFRSGIGGGALIAFSAMVLWTCRRYLLCAAFPGAIQDLEPDACRELRISSLLFLVSSALMIAMLSFGMGANLWFSIFFYLVILLVTIGMIRFVAEGGLLVFQSWFGPFHIIRSTFGMNRPWTSASLFAPLVAFQYVLFWDLKTFIAPAMANALKIRDSLGLRRVGFHLAIWLGMGVAACVAVATHIILGYQNGANTMHKWFHANGPREMFEGITQMATTSPVDTAGGGYWILAGIVITLALLLIRRHRVGLLHPIGLVMWVFPNMWALWFSIFLGWLFKTLVSRYGDRSTYHRFRVFFIGLIIGELLLCLFGIDLNRY